jgi:hypothetical protein
MSLSVKNSNYSNYSNTINSEQSNINKNTKLQSQDISNFYNDTQKELSYILYKLDLDIKSTKYDYYKNYIKQKNPIWRLKSNSKTIAAAKTSVQKYKKRLKKLERAEKLINSYYMNHFANSHKKPDICSVMTDYFSMDIHLKSFGFITDKLDKCHEYVIKDCDAMRFKAAEIFIRTNYVNDFKFFKEFINKKIDFWEKEREIAQNDANKTKDDPDDEFKYYGNMDRLNNAQANLKNLNKLKNNVQHQINHAKHNANYRLYYKIHDNYKNIIDAFFKCEISTLDERIQNKPVSGIDIYDIPNSPLLMYHPHYFKNIFNCSDAENFSRKNTENSINLHQQRSYTSDILYTSNISCESYDEVEKSSVSLTKSTSTQYSNTHDISSESSINHVILSQKNIDKRLLDNFKHDFNIQIKELNAEIETAKEKYIKCRNILNNPINKAVLANENETKRYEIDRQKYALRLNNLRKAKKAVESYKGKHFGLFSGKPDIEAVKKDYLKMLTVVKNYGVNPSANLSAGHNIDDYEKKLADTYGEFMVNNYKSDFNYIKEKVNNTLNYWNSKAEKARNNKRNTNNESKKEQFHVTMNTASNQAKIFEKLKSDLNTQLAFANYYAKKEEKHSELHENYAKIFAAFEVAFRFSVYELPDARKLVYNPDNFANAHPDENQSDDNSDAQSDIIIE